MAKGFPAWTPHYIQHELPYLCGLVYEHAILTGAGIWTVPPKPPDAPVDDSGVDAMLQEEPPDEFP